MRLKVKYHESANKKNVMINGANIDREDNIDSKESIDSVDHQIQKHMSKLNL
jgi:hypothetical protein